MRGRVVARAPCAWPTRGRPVSLEKPICCEPVAAVNDQHGAVDKARRVRTKEDGSGLDVFDQTETSERHALAQLLFDRLRHESFHAFSVLDWTGRDGVHP